MLLIFLLVTRLVHPGLSTGTPTSPDNVIPGKPDPQGMDSSALVSLRDVLHYAADTGTVRYKTLYSICAESGGDFKACHFKAGETIKSGEILAELDNPDLKKNRESLALKLEHDEFALSRFQTYEKAERETQCTLSFQAAEDKYKETGEAVKNSEDLLKRGMISNKDYQKAIQDEKNAESLLKIEKLKQDNLSLSEKNEEKGLEGIVSQDKKELSELDRLIGLLTIRAPISGKIIELSNTFPSEYLQSNKIRIQGGQLIARLADEKGRYVEVRLFGQDIKELKINDPVEILAGPSENIKLEGRIREISTTGIPYGQYFRYPILVEVMTNPETLRSEEIVRCRFLAIRRMKVLSIPLKFLLYKDGSQYCRVKRNLQILEVPVIAGADDGEFIEIVNGLKESEEVIL